MKKLTIRLSDELHEHLAALARKDQRSINREVVWRIEQAVNMEFTHNPTHAGTSLPEQQTAKRTPLQRPDAGAGEGT